MKNLLLPAWLVVAGSAADGASAAEPRGEGNGQTDEPDEQFNAGDFGATACGVTDDAPAAELQRAIDAVTASPGGGLVVTEPGSAPRPKKGAALNHGNVISGYREALWIDPALDPRTVATEAAETAE